MCGIFGVVDDQRPAQIETTLRTMAQITHHRGPDDRGLLVSAKLATGIGMNRLSIVDRAGGHQPIFNEDRTLAIVMNGEIYNHLELRKDLEAKGHRFATKSDTEAVLHLYEEEGPAAMAKLNGMFAVAILNVTSGEMFFARDRFGVKPFFYAEAQGCRFAFASEVKAFAAIEGFSVETSAQAVSDYFSYSYIPLPESILHGVRQLLPGCWMIRRPSGEMETRRYWHPSYDVRPFESENDIVADFRATFRSAVERQLLGEVPIGAFLSGGLDSGAIVATMAELGVKPLHTFSVGFDSAAFDETELIKKTSGKFATTHHHLDFSGDKIADLVGTVTYAQDHPLGLTSFAYYVMAKKAREFVTVTLSGDGGDELFGGYDMYYGHAMLERYRRLPAIMRGFIENQVVARLPNTMSKRGLDVKARKFVEAARFTPARSYIAWREIFPPEEKARLLKGLDRAGGSVNQDPYHAYQKYLEDTSINPVENRLMNADLNQFLVGTTLTIADRVGMANSLEVRVPFLDNELFNFASRLQMKWKLKGMTTKVLLRKAFADVLPPEIVSAPKLGFTPPMGQWFKGPLKPLMAELLNDRELQNRALIDFPYARQIFDEHLSGQVDQSRKLMSLFCYLNWEREFKRRALEVRKPIRDNASPNVDLNVEFV